MWIDQEMNNFSSINQQNLERRWWINEKWVKIQLRNLLVSALMDGNGDKFLFSREVYDAILALYGKMKAAFGHLKKEIGNNIKQKQPN